LSTFLCAESESEESESEASCLAKRIQRMKSEVPFFLILCLSRIVCDMCCVYQSSE